ncbi:hypothetical protein ACED44_09560 [Vibrio splendidus]|uniref:phage major tropism determinant n=1 Tax=Vibrio splendidus TaxID=29497 RepID=UPI00352F5A71
MSEISVTKLTDKVSGKSINVVDLIALFQRPMFTKTAIAAPAFRVVDSAIVVNGTIAVTVGDAVVTAKDGAKLDMPTLNDGTDYAIYATKGGLVISANFTAPPHGYTVETSRQIGGFHYQDDFINEYSIWDLKYKPNVDDPRGMVRTVGGFWADIYLLNATPDLLGTSAYNTMIADSVNRPKVPVAWGGDGTEQYSKFTPYIATEVLAAFGKRLPNQHEFQVLAQGSKEGYSAVTDPVNTKFDVDARSMVGCEQVSGHMWQWGAEHWDRGDGSTGYNWYGVETDGKGKVKTAGIKGVGCSRFGGYYGDSNTSGSRSSDWSYEPWTSVSISAARGICDHHQQI